MKIHLIKNIAFEDDIFICTVKQGICISEFEIEFDEEIEFIDKDHCECIHSLIVPKKNILNVRLVTDKNEIDEYLIFTLKNKNLKIRFQR